MHRSILHLRGKQTNPRINPRINSVDVVHWLLDQTCNGIEQIMPLYLSQGADFVRRTQATLEFPAFLDKPAQRNSYLDVIQTLERQNLGDLYSPKTVSLPAVLPVKLATSLQGFASEIRQRQAGFRDNHSVNSAAFEEVEQEREVAFEVEAVRQLEKPTHFSPLTFPGLDNNLVEFSKTGRIQGNTFVPALAIMAKTDLGKKYGVSPERTSLFVSREYTKTIQTSVPNDNFIVSINTICSIHANILASGKLDSLGSIIGNCNNHHSRGSRCADRPPTRS